MAKTALIVDDSASARLALGRMLAEQDLAVDTAASGEEALEYLRQARPDVIFMDHLMPGMDGFQALEAIKENPATATIPVMMYTSQGGELYVGQARALGAFGVLPKQVQPVEVSKVLRALNLIPDAAVSGAAVPPTSADLDSKRVSALLEDMFDQQRAVLRDEIRRGYERLLESTVQTERAADGSSSAALGTATTWVGGMLLALIAVTFAYLYFETSTLLVRANERIEALRSAAEAVAVSAEPGTAVDTVAASVTPQMLRLLEAAVNQGGSYPFGTTALDENRAQLLGALLEQLSAAGFAGTVEVDVHVGRYCMDIGVDGALVLPPGEQPLEECQQLGWPEPEAFALGEQQTLPFANAISLVTRSEGIELQIVSRGTSEPAVPYPVYTQGLTAGEWNEIAARNQRVEVRVVPE